MCVFVCDRVSKSKSTLLTPLSLFPIYLYLGPFSSFPLPFLLQIFAFPMNYSLVAEAKAAEEFNMNEKQDVHSVAKVEHIVPFLFFSF